MAYLTLTCVLLYTLFTLGVCILEPIAKPERAAPLPQAALHQVAVLVASVDPSNSADQIIVELLEPALASVSSSSPLALSAWELPGWILLMMGFVVHKSL